MNWLNGYELGFGSGSCPIELDPRYRVRSGWGKRVHARRPDQTTPTGVLGHVHRREKAGQAGPFQGAAGFRPTAIGEIGILFQFPNLFRIYTLNMIQIKFEI
jgi:hypothetical protein